ncbi:MAG: TonB-dependent receptor, partial [Pseudomonadota bacterium]
YSVEPYDVIFNFGTPRGLRPGGEGSSNTYSINAGLSYDLTPEATVFANYSQGLQLPDIANSANSLDPGVPLPGSLFVEPIDVEAIDIGIRGFSGNFSYAASVFYSRSDLGEAINLTGAGLGERVRSPQRNWGMELSGSYRASEKLSLSGSLSLQEGEFDRSDDGNFVALNSRTVPPPQLRLQADYQLNAETTIFGSLFASGRRAKAFEEGQDFFEPESYAVVDVGLVYEKDRFRLSAQITNLLNEAYSPVAQSSFIPGRRREGPGRALTITASYKF